MKIIVCVKQVPDTTEVKLNPETGTLIREGVPSIINPDDLSGLEEAIKIKEKTGAHITVISMGPMQAKKALVQAYAMGADRVILLTDRAFSGADTLATSLALSACIKTLDYDLIIAGRQAIDGDTAQVGPQLAQHLGIPNISYVEEIFDYDDKQITLKRQFEDRYHKVRTHFPCLITTLSGMNQPRYMRLSRMVDMFDEDKVEIMSADQIDADKSELGLKGSPTQVRKSFTKGAKASGVKHEVSPEEGAKIIADELEKRHLI